MLLEVCCTSVESAVTAEVNGADRIELCMHLGSGGLTPSVGLARHVVDETELPVFVLIRPREGNFVYSKHEKAVMLYDIAALLDVGVHGVVAGALNGDGTVDFAFTDSVRKATEGVPMTFHRAFDECTQPGAAATALHSMGVERILTSGQSLRAADGIATYRALRQLELCPTLLAGGGVNTEALPELVRCGITEVHFSARKSVHGSIGRGIFDPAYETVDRQRVAEMRAALNALKPEFSA